MWINIFAICDGKLIIWVASLGDVATKEVESFYHNMR